MATILIVDDEEIARLTLGEILRLEGYEISTAASGEEAVEALRQHPYDLMILDLKMTGMSGLDVLEKTAGTTPGLSVIILTAYGTLNTAMQAIRYQVQDYLLKPVSPEQVIESVRRALEKKTPPRVAEPSAEYAEEDRLVELPGCAQLAWDTRQIRWEGGKLSLTPTETRLLRILFDRRNTMVTHSELVYLIQGYQLDGEEAAKILRPVVSRLRQKLAEVPGWDDRIKNVRGAGYVLEWKTGSPAS